MIKGVRNGREALQIYKHATSGTIAFVNVGWVLSRRVG